MEKRPARRPREARQKSEFEDKTIEIRRVNRVVKGGKRFSFRATVVIGNKRGKVGVGMAKGLDIQAAIEKAKRQAEKEVFFVPLKDKRTIPYDVLAKYRASRVLLKPVRAGHGLIAGGPVRIVLDLAGVKDISAKILGKTTNKLTNAMATIAALKKFTAKEETGKTIEDALDALENTDENDEETQS
ncbi:MAG: 30S ribosomal protein S5 [Patescibacteria group bacterium]